MFPKIIGIVGPIRAGKTTCAKFLVENYGYTLASNSDILKRILIGMRMAPNRSNLAALGDSMFEVFGNDLLARYRLDNLHLGNIVVDGIRYPEEIKRYSEESSFKLLGVTAELNMRFERAVKESEELKDPDISKIDFDQFSKARSELSVPQLLLTADEVVYNVENLERLEFKLSKILGNWSK